VASAEARTAQIAIIIDDLGGNQALGRRALKLPGKLTYAFLPFTASGPELAERAYQLGKEVMLHLPMESLVARPLGPMGLRMDMTREHVRKNIRAALASVPHVRGVNNHMGSLLTRHPGYMQWVMEEIKAMGDLYFIDSRTTHHTVAEFIAVENAVPVRRRDVFLDNEQDIEAIRDQFQRLINKAMRQGSAIGIGHPYESTLAVLEEILPQLADMNVRLVSASELVYGFVPGNVLRQYLAATPAIESGREISEVEPFKSVDVGDLPVGTVPAI